MGYSFNESDGSVAEAVRRIAVERVAEAQDALGDPAGGDEAVHTVRKRMKQLRALVRLVADGLPAAKREDRAFRDVARALSGSRDAAVMAATFDQLAREAPRPLDIDAAYAIRTMLAGMKDGAGAEDRAGASEGLSEARTRVAAWSLDESGWAALEHGLTGTYARARKMMKSALKSGDDEAVHEWRKLAKAHYYHLELMQPTWEKAIKPQLKAADRLQEALGEHHDLGVLREVLQERADDVGGTAPLGPVLGLIAARQAALADEAHALGARLFAEDPDAFAARMHGWWKEWRRELKAGERLAA